MATTQTYLQMLSRIAALEEEAGKTRQRELGDVIAKVKETIKLYSLSSEDLGLTGKSASKKNPYVSAIRYRSGQNTWTGRGRSPDWLRQAVQAGASPSDFAV